MGTEQPEKTEAARQALREIEKIRLKLEAGDPASPKFGDFMVEAVGMIGNLATDAIRRGEALEPDDRSG